jgi:hypothetical protein
VHINPAEGYCPTLPAHCAYVVCFVGVDRPNRVLDANDEPLSWSFDPDERRLQVTLPAQPKCEAVALVLQWACSSPEEAQGLDEGAGACRSGAPPFAHLIAYTASDEARHSLGRVILVPPYGLDQAVRACDAEVLWRDARAAGATEIRQVVPDLSPPRPS